MPRRSLRRSEQHKGVTEEPQASKPSRTDYFTESQRQILLHQITVTLLSPPTDPVLASTTLV